MSKSYNKKSVALAQLETALRLFQEDDLFSAGTLAGAAEEILGGMSPPPPFPSGVLQTITDKRQIPSYK